jgi:hypothetical protein
MPSEHREHDGGRPKWPEPASDQAFHGLAGHAVRALEPHTEADPIALLIHIIVMFGNVIGRGAFFCVGATKHAANLFALLAGRTGKGRKGTAHDQALDLYRAADPDWVKRCVQTGLTSGEGLIHAVRDPAAARVVGGRRVPPDPGVSDKRLLAVESEFSAVLRNANRTGNILSPTMRQAWDGGDLRVMGKTSPDVATGAHISIIGHTTREELKAELSTTDRANGFGNRFLYLCVKRSKYLPDGGELPPALREQLGSDLKDAISFASGAGELRRDSAASDLWHEVYAGLSDGQPGLAGAMLSRAEAQVLRLSCVYALLDKSHVVRVEHLRAALALWAYAEQSTRYLFGNALGNPTADLILDRLRVTAAGLSRTEIRDLLSRHAPTGSIAAALDLLQELGLARSQRVETAGRPSEKWFATAQAAPESPGSSGE